MKMVQFSKKMEKILLMCLHNRLKEVLEATLWKPLKANDKVEGATMGAK